MKIMLLGSLPKGDEARKSFVDWKKEYIEKLTSSIPGAKIIHGDKISDSVGPELVVGHDLWLLKGADILIVNAKSKVGAGTAQEMVLAKYFKKPVISVIPKDSHHRRSNVVFDGENVEEWIHPFLFVSSDLIVENIDEAIPWINYYMKNPSKAKIKDISVFDKAIGKFEKELKEIVGKYKKELR
jgi:GTP:adenosylcobinamide-phosphate guanylyltransferase